MKLENYKNFNFGDYAKNYETNIIENVRTLMEKKKCTQSDVARAVYLDESTLSKMLKQEEKKKKKANENENENENESKKKKGKRLAQRVPVDTLFYLAEYFNVSVYDLVSNPQNSDELSKREKEEKEELANKIESFISSRTNMKVLRRKNFTQNIINLIEDFCNCENRK